MEQQLILVLLVGAIALGKWLLEKATQAPEDSGNADEPTHRQSIPQRGESEEEKMRRFMDALGLPSGEEPPARPSAMPPERHAVEPAPPMIDRQSPALPPQPSPARRVRPPRQTPMGGPNPWGGQKPRPSQHRREVPPALRPEPPSFTPSAPAPAFSPAQTVEMTSVSMESVAPQMEVASFGQASSRQQSSGSLFTKLRDPKALREALVLREILGPPKALSPH